MSALISIKLARLARAIMLCMVTSVAARTALALDLPEPRRDGAYPLERALAERRSVREFGDAALRLEELAQLLWAAQGQSAPDGRRTAPSAGALYPLELLVVAGRVQGLAAGVYRYQAARHRLARVAEGDRRTQLVEAAFGQRWIGQAPVILVVAGVEQRTRAKYGTRAARYVHLEAGHAAQNALLQAVALGLGATVVGAFGDAEVKSVAELRADEQPLYLIPMGRPR
jgi:SagB-type dehydrogenase family enzyme